jgi:hypothetical protein
MTFKRNKIRGAVLILFVQFFVFACTNAKATKPVGSTVKMSEEEIKKKLTPKQYHILREAGTEPAFKNEYWNNHEEGIYVDPITNEPLFSSLDKYDSGTGWPSFTQKLRKPRSFGKRCMRGFWPPSKPGFLLEPVRAPCPLVPRPAVLPWPAAIPRPTRLPVFFGVEVSS